MSAFNSTLALIFERNQEATLFVGNLDPQVNEEILWELFTQCGPVQKIYLPKDKVSQTHNGFAFVELRTMEDADYAIKILHMIKLFNKPIKVNKATQDKRVQEVQCSKCNVQRVFSNHRGAEEQRPILLLSFVRGASQNATQV